MPITSKPRKTKLGVGPRGAYTPTLRALLLLRMLGLPDQYACAGAGVSQTTWIAFKKANPELVETADKTILAKEVLIAWRGMRQSLSKDGKLAAAVTRALIEKAVEDDNAAAQNQRLASSQG